MKLLLLVVLGFCCGLLDVTNSHPTKVGGNEEPLRGLKLDLPDVIKYLEWVGSLDTEAISYEASDILGRMEYTSYDLLQDYIDIVNAAQDEFDASILFDDLLTHVDENGLLFSGASGDFMRNWVDDYAHIDIHLAKYLSEIKPIVPNITEHILTLNVKLVDTALHYLTPEALANVTMLVNKQLVDLDKATLELVQLIFPNATSIGGHHNAQTNENDWTPMNITVPGFLAFVEWLGGLDVEEITYGTMETLKELRTERENFNLALYSILLEAGGTEFESQGRQIVDTYQAFYDEKKLTYNNALNTFFYEWVHGNIWAALSALADFLEVLRSNILDIPPVTIEAIQSLEQLVQTAPAEFVQKAEVLLDQTLMRVDEIVQNYYGLWIPGPNRDH